MITARDWPARACQRFVSTGAPGKDEHVRSYPILRSCSGRWVWVVGVFLSLSLSLTRSFTAFSFSFPLSYRSLCFLSCGRFHGIGNGSLSFDLIWRFGISFTYVGLTCDDFYPVCVIISYTIRVTCDFYRAEKNVAVTGWVIGQPRESSLHRGERYWFYFQQLISARINAYYRVLSVSSDWQ